MKYLKTSSIHFFILLILCHCLIVVVGLPNEMYGLHRLRPLNDHSLTPFILCRYLYNETVNLQSVMTALTTLYAAHKYMCPGLAKQVMRFYNHEYSPS